MEAKQERRIRDKKRMKAKARRIYPQNPTARLADHLAVHSGPMSGNPRRHWGKVTMQERKEEAKRAA